MTPQKYAHPKLWKLCICYLYVKGDIIIFELSETVIIC